MDQLIVIDTVEGLKNLQEYLNDKDLIAFDTETTGLEKGAEIIGASFCAEEDKAFYVILSKYNTTTNSLDYTELKSEFVDLLKGLLDKQFVMHNGLFDCMKVEENYKISLINSLHTDTMVLAHLLNENRRIGLKELAKEYFGDESAEEARLVKDSIKVNGGSTTNGSYELYKADWQLIAKYGAKDALLTYKLFLQLIPELYEQGLEDFFYKDESMPLLRGPTYELNSTGLRVDVTALMTLKKTLEAECLEAKDFINSEIASHIKDKYPGTKKSNTFNIGSTQQLSWLLFSKYELEFGTLTKKGREICKDYLGLRLPYTYGAKKQFIYDCERHTNPKINNPWKYIQVDNQTLQKLAPKYKWIEKFVEYKKKLKLLNTYVTGIEERIQYGIIYPSFLQTGTTSGRYSSRSPNFQNLPRDDKRIKDCIIARPGKVFVGADYSQLEPRIFAYFSADPRLLSAFDGKTDFYSVIGMEIFNKTDCTPQKEGSPNAFGVKYKYLRDISKTIALAAAYGAMANQLSKSTKKSPEDTQLDMDNYFESFPGVKKQMLEAHAIAKKEGQVKNFFGRPRRMPEALKITSIYGDLEHSEYPYEIRNNLNLAVNHRIQSTGASIVNRAAIAFCNKSKELSLDCKVILQVHDSLVIECDEKDAEDVSLLLQHCMENTVELPGIVLEASPKIGHTLKEV